MIHSKELRINNWVFNYYTQKPQQVYPMMIAQLATIEEDGADSMMHGVPLTEDILTNNGWILKQKESLKIYHYPEFSYFRIIFYENGEWILGMDCNPLIHVLSDDLKYIHQLQNAFYAVSLKELPIKL